MTTDPGLRSLLGLASLPKERVASTRARGPRTVSSMTRLLLAASVVALAGAGSAAAALAPLFDRTHARVGERVVVSAGYVGTESQARRIVLYLVPLAMAPRFGLTPTAGRPPTLRGVVSLGTPHRNRDGLGTLAFRVPSGAHGRYTLGVWCATCLRGGDHWAMASAQWVANPRAILTVDRA